MFDGLANEVSRLSEYALNHPLTKVSMALFGIAFITIMIFVITFNIRVHKTMKRKNRW